MSELPDNPSSTPLASGFDGIELINANLLHNISALKSYIHSTNDTPKKVIAAVKANAYGHGMKEVVAALAKEVDYWQIDDIRELESLRNYTESPILLLGHVPAAQITHALSLGAQLAVWSIDTLHEINAAAAKQNVTAKIHIGIDSHLGREGFMPTDIEAIVSALQECENIYVEGVYSHFANIEDTADFTHAQKQIDTFTAAVNTLRERGVNPPCVHISATSGSLVYEVDNALTTAVRLGIGLYGLWPSEDLKKRLEDKLQLLPVMRWRSYVSLVKHLPANHTVGYGLTYTAQNPITLALVPVGYSDGFDRGFSNNGLVLINDTPCPVIGRVAMNMFAVDATNVKDIHELSAVFILDGAYEEISAERLAERIDTINYEIVARISPLLPRILV